MRAVRPSEAAKARWWGPRTKMSSFDDGSTRERQVSARAPSVRNGSKALSTVLRADSSFITAENREIRAVDQASRNLWRVPLAGDAVTSPAVLANGDIVLADSQGSVRMFRSDGAPLWEARLRAQVTGIAASSVGHGVYVTTHDGRLRALDAATGHPIWMTSIDDRPLGAPALAPFGIVYLGSSKGFHRVSAKNGRVLGSVNSTSGVSEAPALTNDDGAVFGSGDGVLHGTTADGVVRWSYSMGSPLSAPPIIDVANHIFLTTSVRRVVALRDAGHRVEPLWAIHLDEEPLGSPVIGPLGALYVFIKTGEVLELGNAPADVNTLVSPLRCPCAALRCGVLLGLCNGETGCRAILDCANREKCRGNECRRPDVCDETIQQYGGPLGQSHALAAGLEDCVMRNCPNCQ